jgi:hypothetical protein
MDKPFDIILLDHQLDGGLLGINVLEEISEEFGQDYQRRSLYCYHGCS